MSSTLVLYRTAPEPQWYAFRVQPAKECRLHDAAMEVGLVSLFPHRIEKVMGRKSNRPIVKREITRALFVGYGLVSDEGRLSADEIEWNVRRLHYYAGPQRGHLPFVRSWLGPVVTGKAQLDALHQCHGLVEEPTPTQAWRPQKGDKVRIHTGSFASQNPVVIEVVTKTKARVTIGSLSVSVPIELMEAA